MVTVTLIQRKKKKKQPYKYAELAHQIRGIRSSRKKRIKTPCVPRIESPVSIYYRLPCSFRYYGFSPFFPVVAVVGLVGGWYISGWKFSLWKWLGLNGEFLNVVV
jgi:hypothetical protein